MEKGLLQKPEYKGKYVALKSPNNQTVIAEGDSPSAVRKAASQKGVSEPLIFFVSEPESEVRRCY